MKKNMTIMLVLLMILSLLLGGCTGEGQGANNTSPAGGNLQQNQGMPQNSAGEVIRDLSIKVKNAYEGPAETDTVEETSALLDADWNTDLKDMVKVSGVIIEGTVKNVTYVPHDDMAFTKLDVLVVDSIKGDLKAGDLISVYVYGGYIPFKVFYEYNKAHFEETDLSEEDMEKMVMKKTFDNEELHKEGKRSLFMLIPVTDDPGEEIAPVGSYWRTCEKYSEYEIVTGSTTKNGEQLYQREAPDTKDSGVLTAEPITKETIRNLLK